MSTRWSLLLLAGLTGCAMPYRGNGPGVRPVVVDPGPRLVVVVGTDLRYCEDCDDDMFFYSNIWWAYRPDGWYQCTALGAPWVVVELGRLPVEFIRVPPGRFKHRYGTRHPAHDHHPSLDRWEAAATPERGDRDQRDVARPAAGEAGRGRDAAPATVPEPEVMVAGDRANHRNQDVKNSDGDEQDRDKEKGKEMVKEKKDKGKDKDKEKDKDKSRDKGKSKSKKQGASSH